MLTTELADLASHMLKTNTEIEKKYIEVKDKNR